MVVPVDVKADAALGLAAWLALASLGGCPAPRRSLLRSPPQAARGGVLERTLGRGSRAWRASEGGDHRVPSLYCRLCRVKTRMVVGKFRFSIRVSAVTTLITHKVCSASRLAADITFFTSHVDPFKVVRLSEFKSKKSMTMRENSARTNYPHPGVNSQLGGRATYLPQPTSY